MAEFARALGMRPQTLNNYLAGQAKPGNVLQARLRELGCDIEWLMTGKKAGYARTQQRSARVNEALIEFNAPGGVPPNVKKKMQKLAKRLSKLKGEEIDKIDKLLDIYLNEKD